MLYTPSEPRTYYRRGKEQKGRYEVDLRGVLDNGFEVVRERRVFPPTAAGGRIGKRQAAAMAAQEFERWNRHGQVLRPGVAPALARTAGMTAGTAPTFAQFATDYLDFCASPNACRNGANSRSTMKNKEIALRLHLLPAFGTMRMDQLQRRDVDRFIAAAAKAGRASNTISSDVDCLRHMLTIAKRHELIEKFPEFATPKRSSKIVALQPAEAKRFLSFLRSDVPLRNATLFELYLRAGLRRGEGLALRPVDFNLRAAKPTIRVSQSVTDGRIGPTKGRNVRLVPLARSLVPRIDELLAERELSHRSDAFLFASPIIPTQPLASTVPGKLVKKFGKSLGLDSLRVHMLRHTFGTDCARRGVPLLTIKEWMGHADVKVTMGYLHLAAPDHLRWADLLDD